MQKLNQLSNLIQLDPISLISTKTSTSTNFSILTHASDTQIIFYIAWIYRIGKCVVVDFFSSFTSISVHCLNKSHVYCTHACLYICLSLIYKRWDLLEISTLIVRTFYRLMHAYVHVWVQMFAWELPESGKMYEYRFKWQPKP